MDLNKIAEQVDLINRNLETFRKSHDEQIAHIQEKGAKHGDIEQKLVAMQGDISTAIGQITEIKREVALAGEFKQRDGDVRLTPEQKAARDIFIGWMRKGDERMSSMTDVERKALNTLSNPDGGYFVPVDTNGRIIEKVQLMSPVRQYAAAQTISGNALEGVVDNGEFDSGWVAEMASRPKTNASQVGKYRIGVHERYAKPMATQTYLDDAAIDVEAWIARKIAEKFARTEAVAFLTGDGVDKPKGLLSQTFSTSKDASRAWGTVQKVKTGANGAFVASPNGGDVIIKTITELHSKYWAGALFMMNRYTLAEVMKLKDGDGNYLWMPDFQAGGVGTLKGFRVDASFDHLEDSTDTGAKAIIFGNLAEAYQIVDKAGVALLRDPYSSKPFVEFYATSRVGGDVINSEAYKVITFES